MQARVVERNAWNGLQGARAAYDEDPNPTNEAVLRHSQAFYRDTLARISP